MGESSCGSFLARYLNLPQGAFPFNASKSYFGQE
jgi:hypothetical protein